MKFFARFNNFIEELDEKDLQKYIIIFSIFIALITGGIIFHYRNSINKLTEKIDNINNQRKKTERLLYDKKIVTEQYEKVKKILAKNPNFLIRGYFEKELLPKLNLDKNKFTVDTMEEDISDEYTEIKLNANLTNLNTKDLCNILNALEEQERIYIKNVEISHHQQNPNVIDINLTIATLQPKPNTNE